MKSLREEIEHYMVMIDRPDEAADIISMIEKRIDDMIKEESQGSIYNATSDSVLTLKQVKEILK